MFNRERKTTNHTGMQHLLLRLVCVALVLFHACADSEVRDAVTHPSVPQFDELFEASLSLDSSSDPDSQLKAFFSRARGWEKFRSNSESECQPGVTPCYRPNKAVYPNRRGVPCYADDRGVDYETACSCPCCACS
jgi:hypothetical protein